MQDEEHDHEEYPAAYEVEVRVEGVIKMMVSASSRDAAETIAQTKIPEYIGVSQAKAVGATAKEPRPQYKGGHHPQKIGVHVTHCCVLHGCKYGHEDCPVETGVYAQAYPCMDCDPSEQY